VVMTSRIGNWMNYDGIYELVVFGSRSFLRKISSFVDLSILLHDLKLVHAYLVASYYTKRVNENNVFNSDIDHLAEIFKVI
jgi:hypothetical protein